MHNLHQKSDTCKYPDKQDANETHRSMTYRSSIEYIEQDHHSNREEEKEDGETKQTYTE